MTTIYDVAKAAEVSPATVSRVFSGAPVSDALTRRVRARAAELGFVPNGVARSLRLQRSDVIALIIPDIENPFFTALARGVEDAARATGLSVVLCNSDENVEREARYLQVAAGQQMAGVVIAPASQRSTDLRPLLAKGIPVVAVDRRPHDADVDVVMVDNRRGGQQATAHLYDKGYRRVACITGPVGASTADERLLGYTLEVQARLAPTGQSSRGSARHVRRYVRRGDFRIDGGRAAMHSLLAMELSPDAVFVANNLMAIGAIEALSDAGISLPEFGFIHFGDLPWTRLFTPRLSAISQPARQLGSTATEVLQERIAGRDGPTRTIVLNTELVARESTSRVPSEYTQEVATAATSG